MDIKASIRSILSELPSHVKLVAISKTKPASDILAAYDAGQRIFGENKVQEIVPKYEALPKDIEWHMVGHLQSNKVKYIAPFIHLIHSVDSLNLLSEINKQAVRCNRTINCLLQVHIAMEETKFGFSEKELFQLLDSAGFHSLKNVSVTGLMGMATFTDDTEKVRSEFRHLASVFKELKQHKFSNNLEFRELSMGMSSDYQIAVKEGSTMVRIGSNIFGERNYSK